MYHLKCFNITEPHSIDGMMPLDMNAPSPIHMESPGSPLMNLPLPPFMPPPPLIGNAPPFLPPPPLVPISTGEMRPAPLGKFSKNHSKLICFKLKMIFRSSHVTATITK